MFFFCTFLCDDFAINEFNALLAGSASNPVTLSGSESGVVKKNATSRTASKTFDAFLESKSGIVQNNATSKPTSKTFGTTSFKGKLIRFIFTIEKCFGVWWCVMRFILVCSTVLFPWFGW